MINRTSKSVTVYEYKGVEYDSLLEAQVAMLADILHNDFTACEASAFIKYLVHLLNI